MAYNLTNRKIKADITKKKIYNSAIKLFAEKEFSQVSVDSIVKEAGVAKGSFYVHYSSKDSIIVEIVNEYVKFVDTDYLNSVHNIKDTSFYNQILKLIERITEVLKYDIGCDKMKTLYKAQLGDTLGTDSVISYSRKLYMLMKNLIIGGIKSGEFKSSLSAETLARQFLMAIRGITFEWCLRSNEFEYKEQALSLFNILLDGIKA